jgi:uncharacterized protein (TIGR03545 family)
MSETPTPGARKSAFALRPSGLLVFVGFLAVVVVLGRLFANRWVERGIENTATALVGAQVDLESVRLSVFEGSLSLTGLQVTNPDRPMSNLFEADEIVADIVLEPLLRRKVMIEQLALTGLRFDTEREVSGAIENPDPETGALWRQVNGWAESLNLPELSIAGLGGSVNTAALDADSLRSVRFAREARREADSLRADWDSRVAEIDPRPRIDSLRAVVERLEAFRLTPMSALQVPGLIRDGRAALSGAVGLESAVVDLQDRVRSGMTELSWEPGLVSELRSQDLAYARGLLEIPSLDAPSLSPSLLGGSALSWLRPVLYWVQAAERFLPPGLDPRNRPGPRRARAEGTTVRFLEGADEPAFLLQEGRLGVELGGSGGDPDTYSAVLRNLTSAPALLGLPMVLELGRQSGDAGPSAIEVFAELDHTGSVVRDSLLARLSGVTLPDLSLGSVGGSLSLGAGEHSVRVERTGDQIDARIQWTTDQVEWRPPPSEVPGATAERGSPAWARSLVHRALADIDRVDVELTLRGDLDAPSIGVTSNVADVVAEAFRRELGEEIAAAEAEVRAEVNRLVQPAIQDARGRVDDLQSSIADRVDAQRAEIEDLRARLEQRLAELVR